MSLIQCPNCKNDVSSEAAQCPHCKIKLYPQYGLCQCPECQNTIRIDQWTCPHCGYQRSKIDFLDKALTGCLIKGISFALYAFIAWLCLAALYNAIFG
jgi:hypothetical protein